MTDKSFRKAPQSTSETHMGLGILLHRADGLTQSVVNLNWRQNESSKASRMDFTLFKQQAVTDRGEL